MLARISISTKLFAIVSFLFLVIAIIGGIAFLQMRAINSAAQHIQAQWLPSVRWLGEMRVQSARFRAVLRDHLIVPDAERADVDKNLSARKADFDKAAKAYRPLISSPAEHDLAEQLEKQWQSFISASADVQSLASKGDVAGAKGVNASKVVPTGLRIKGSEIDVITASPRWLRRPAATADRARPRAPPARCGG